MTTIKNSDREMIADKLTAQAVSKSLAAVKKSVDRVNKKFCDAHIKKAEKALGIKKDKWPELIQQGMLAATTVCYPDVREKFIVYADKEKMYEYAAEVAVINSPAWQVMNQYFGTWRSEYNKSKHSFIFCFTQSVPYMKGMETIPTDGELIKDMTSTYQEIRKIFDEARKFRADVMNVLHSCRTQKKLEELLPEAAKLLPPIPAKTTVLVPVEVAKRVQEALKTGVPKPEVL